MKKFIIVSATLVLCLSVACQPEDVGRGVTETIVFGDLSWDSALVHNRIAGFIVENGLEGYDTDYVPGETIVLFNGVVQGDVDVLMESWHSNYPEAFAEGMATGEVLDLGKNLPDAPQGWYVPRYIVEGSSAPASDLRSVGDLSNYWNLFIDPEDSSRGIVYLGPPGWGSTQISENLFNEYGLGEWFNEGRPGSGAALAATMVGAYEREEAWVGYYWEPTAVLGRLDMVRLEGSEFDPADINILANVSLEERAPEVVEFLRAYNTGIADNNRFLAEKEAQGWDADETAAWFLTNFESVWTQWVSEDVAMRVRAELQ